MMKGLWIIGIAAAMTAAASGQQLTTVRIATGLTRPLFVVAPPGDTSRLFIVEQRGSGGVGSRASIRILRLADNTIKSQPFLTIDGVAQGMEQGLLGLAFAPDYATSGEFYIDYTDSSGTLVVERYHVSADPDVADAASVQTIITQAHPQDNHNGGWMAFGPDGYLYISWGDGGGSGDPNGNSQSLTSLLGKILRIDVSGGIAGYTIPPTNPFFGLGSVRGEIWAYGLRNAWRNCFDRATGDLWIADVGQDQWEEIDFQPAALTPPFAAVNYGWRCYEGNAPYSSTTGPSGQPCPDPSMLKFPIYTYDHSTSCSISGGYIYRGNAIPALRGTYFFADYCSSQIFSLRYDGVNVSQLTNRTAELANPGQTINGIASFGEDAAGEMYICDQGGGEIYRITPRCWANCDGSNSPPVLNALDFGCFLNAFAAGDPYTNCDGSSVPPMMNVLDFGCFLNKYAAGCP